MSSVTFCFSQIVIYIYIYLCVCVCVCVCVWISRHCGGGSADWRVVSLVVWVPFEPPESIWSQMWSSHKQLSCSSKIWKVDYMIYLVAEKHKKRESMNSSWDRLGFGFGTRGQLEGTCIFYESTLHWLYDICLLCLYFPVTHEQTKI
jgi:hypothetical protein